MPHERAGYKWDLGQLLIEGLGPDEPLGMILAELGVANLVSTRIDDRSYVFPDFALTQPEQYQGVQWRLNRLRELFPEEKAGLDRYWADYVRFTSVMTLARRMEEAFGLSGLHWRLRLYLRLMPFLTKKDWDAQRLMDAYFSSDMLKLVFTSIMADFFTAPREFVGLAVSALNPEASFGKRMPRELGKDAQQLYHYSILGGISTLVDALVGKIKSHGSRIFLGCTATKIRVEEGRA